MTVKILFYAVFIFFLSVTEMLYAQNRDCGKPNNCPNKKYPYKQCYNGEIICTDAPSSHTPTLKHLPDDLEPICLDYELSAYRPGDVKMPTPRGEVVVFRDDPETMKASIDCALYQWNCLCNKENEECKCKVKLKWSTVPEHFPNPEATFATTRVAIQYDKNDHNKCWLNCDKSYILLNNTSDFHGRDSWGYYRWFFYNTGDNIYEDLSERHYVINLCDVLAHEIGHLFGLADYRRNEQTRCPPDISFGIMEGFVGDGYYLNYNQGRKGLSQDDKCAFMKLMCPKLLPVEEEIASRNDKIYPNPATSKTSINFYCERNGRVNFTLVNQLGQKIQNFERAYSEGEHTMVFDISDFPPGVYFCIIEFVGKKEIRKVEVIK